jgi:protein TonB
LNTVSQQPVITPVDRFGLTLCLAILAHAIIILGISFTGEDKLPPSYDTMEIILVQQSDPEAAADARLLAQANLQGGGETEDAIPATPLPPPFPSQQAEITAPPDTPSLPPEPVAEAQQQQETATKSSQEELLRQLTAETDDPDAAEAEIEQDTERPDQDNPVKKSAAELLRNSFKIASLSARIKQKLEQSASRPKRTFISASTKEYKYAAYMESWRAKVERVGNLNYPDEARRQKLSGSLILDVALNPDGSINQITIRSSSGRKILDDAAVRIVMLASPFAPFPENISKDTDILHITRTWQFINNSGFR